MCLRKVGSFLRTIQIDPIAEFYNLYEFLRTLNGFIDFYQKENPMAALANFYFTFCCESRDKSEVFVYGTGKSWGTCTVANNELNDLINKSCYTCYT